MVAAVTVLPAAQFSAAGHFHVTSAAIGPSVAVVRTVSVALSSAAPTQPALSLVAVVVAARVARLPRLLFVCPAHARVSTDQLKSVLDDYKPPADPLSPSQLSPHKFLQHVTFMHTTQSPTKEHTKEHLMHRDFIG